MSDRPSTLVLILANMMPLAGVVWLEWDVLAILLLYWTESVTIGILNVFRMIASQSENLLEGFLPSVAGNEAAATELAGKIPNIPLTPFKFFLVPFFILHYGGFCYGHLIAVVGLFSDAGLTMRNASALPVFSDTTFWIAAGAIFVSHLFSFFSNYIGGDEYRRTSLFLLMHRPYGRIVAMHIAIVLGAGLVMWLGSPLPMLLVLVIAKTTLDLRLHRRERDKLGPALAA